MKFDRIWPLVGHLPYTNKDRCRRLYDIITSAGISAVLELGIAYGKTLCISAAAAQEVSTEWAVIGVDLAEAVGWHRPTAEETVSACGFSDNVTISRQAVSYEWWLLHRLSVGYRGEFGLIFLDGAHLVYSDAGAFFMAEKLLAPGGYIILDDIPWVPAKGMTAPIIWGRDIRSWSDEEQNSPHMAMIWEHLVKEHPNLGEFNRDDPWWGIARKVGTRDDR